MKYDLKIQGKNTTYHFRILNCPNINEQKEGEIEAMEIVKDIEAMKLAQGIKREFIFRNLRDLMEFRK